MDYTSTKINFYTNYNGNNYQLLYDNEVSSAYNIISSNGPTNLLDKVTKIKDILNNISVDWYDAVEEEFQSYKESCVSALGIIRDSVNNQFISSASNAYKNLKSDLESLKSSNDKYQTDFDSKPNESSYISEDDDGTGSMENQGEW